MNVEQLERLREYIPLMKAEIKTDTNGSGIVQDALAKLEAVLMEELKNYVWGRYLEAEG